MYMAVSRINTFAVEMQHIQMAASPIIVAPVIELKVGPEPTANPLSVYCLPISGGGFVAQLGLLSELYVAKWIAEGKRLKGSKAYQPNLVFASSGGNVAAYIAMAGDWSPEGMTRVAEKISTPMFIRSWFPDYMSFIPTWIIGGGQGICVS